jgi:uncharacterized protein
MRFSYYNIPVPVEGGVVLYNTLYKNIAELSNVENITLHNLTLRNFSPHNDKEVGLLKTLTDQMFVIDDDMDEMEYFKLGYNRSLYSSGIVRHTVLPNLACNCDCPYCFESKTGKFMSKETEEGYLTWLKPQLVEAKNFYLTWFGGEPLLSKNTIIRITERILEMQEKYGFDYSASLVTNGVLLDEKFVDMIDQLHIKSVQITIDGDRQIHDKYRFLKGANKGTFDTILANMALYCEKVSSDVASILRINVTDENYNTIENLLKKVPDVIRKRCVVLFRWVYSHTDGRSPGVEFSERLKGDSPTTNLSLLYQKAEEAGFTTNSFDEGVSYNFCECDFDKAFLIDQDGDLYTCSHSMKKEEAVGNVNDGFGSQKNLSRYAKFVNANPFQDGECLECKILPICKGGCRKARFIGKRTCSDIKYDISSYVLQKYHKALGENS